MKTNFLILSICLMTLSSCSQDISTNTTVESATIDFLNDTSKWNGGETTARSVFLHYNIAEILKTLEIVEVKHIEEKKVAVAFFKFSVKNKKIKSAFWLRQVQGNWAAIAIPPDEYTISYIGYDEVTPELEALFSKIEKWEADNPTVWWN